MFSLAEGAQRRPSGPPSAPQTPRSAGTPVLGRATGVGPMAAGTKEPSLGALGQRWVLWWGGVGGGGSLTLGCPCFADLVSCLVRGTHYTQEHVR